MSGRRGKRILVVDDSAYTRQILRGILEADPIVGEVEGAGNGQIALDKALRRPPDAVVLDLHMPVMDGFTFLRLFRTRSDAPVIVVSAFSELDNVEKSLELGASGFISKPDDPYRDLKAISEELQLKLRLYLGASTAHRFHGTVEQGAPSGRQRVEEPPGPRPSRPNFPVIVIGSSSGGPPTLQYLLTGLPTRLEAAVLIAQHLPPGFTQSFAQRLNSLIPHPVREARDGDLVRPGEILVSPGGRNLEVQGSGKSPRAVVTDPGTNLQVPSVDHLLESAAEVFGERLTAIILTGMGRDGSKGVRRVKERGGIVLAESAETAAIYGMPREAAATGCVDEVLPLPEIAVRLIHIACGDQEA